MTRHQLFHFFFLSVFVLLLYQFACIMQPFMTPILGAVVLILLSYPLHGRLARWFPKRSPSFRAALATILVTSAIVIPFLLTCWLLVNEAQSMSPILQQWGATIQVWRAGYHALNIPWILELESVLRRTLGIGRIQFERAAVEGISAVLGWVSDAGRETARNAVISIGHLLIMVFTFFFLFRDGDSLLGAAKRFIPMRLENKNRIAERLRMTVTEIVRGSIQTLSAMIGYWILGVPAAITLGFATGVASFIPVIGSALVWAPVGIFFLLQGALAKGVLILLWGVVVISTLDNLLRSYLIGRKAELPILFLFFSIVGGVKLYGIKGLLLGPLLVAIIPVFLDIYRDQYLRKEKPEQIDDADESL
jgi:predicted PurR-regulated permease PerM